WSPDGKWLAYSLASRPAGHVLRPGWLFEPAIDAPEAAKAEARPEAPGGVRYRLWATRVEDGTSVLLEDGKGPLPSPGWSPDGQALAFGRLVPEEEGGRFEIVVQDGPDRQRVLQATRIAGPISEAAGLPGLAVAWSPDGRYLAVPQLRPHGLAI